MHFNEPLFVSFYLLCSDYIVTKYGKETFTEICVQWPVAQSIDTDCGFVVQFVAWIFWFIAWEILRQQLNRIRGFFFVALFTIRIESRARLIAIDRIQRTNRNEKKTSMKKLKMIITILKYANIFGNEIQFQHLAHNCNYE